MQNAQGKEEGEVLVFFEPHGDGWASELVIPPAAPGLRGQVSRFPLPTAKDEAGALKEAAGYWTYPARVVTYREAMNPFGPERF